jgi:hypothetical protein
MTRLSLIWIFFLPWHCAFASTLPDPAAFKGPLQKDIILAPNGDDQKGDGSLSAPFRTLRRAAQVAGPGSTIRLRGGTYSGSAERITLVGAHQTPVSIRPFENEKPILDGTGVGERLEIEAEDKANVFAVLNLVNSRFVNVDGLEIRNSVGKGVHVWNSQDIRVSHLNVHHTWSGGISAMGDRLTFENNEVHDSALLNENDLVLKQRERGIISYWPGGVGTWRKED